MSKIYFYCLKSTFFKKGALMLEIGRINACGKKYAPVRWELKTHVGNNRLYYIHDGVGGYRHHNQYFEFAPNTLYYIPYTADFVPFCEKSDPIVHTYIDFELLPPIISDRVLSLSTKESNTLAAALSAFELGGGRPKKNHTDLSAFYRDPPLGELCKAAVIYLTDRIASANEVKKISDETVISALGIMHTRLHESISVSHLAQSVYMNEDSFIRRFHKVVGTTPYAYLKNLRLRTALYLRNSGMGLTEIAKEVGYSDASSLLHALKPYL